MDTNILSPAKSTHSLDVIIKLILYQKTHMTKGKKVIRHYYTSLLVFFIVAKYEFLIYDSETLNMEIKAFQIIYISNFFNQK